MAIFITGDAHGNFTRFEKKIFYEQSELTKEDCVIITGDFGGILEPDDPQFKKKCRKLDHSGALYRVNHRSWWKEELPSEEEYRTARASLGQHSWKVDYIITHCGPTSVQNELSRGFYKADALTDFLDEVTGRCQFRNWFFGHYHDNGTIRRKFILLYEQIIQL